MEFESIQEISAASADGSAHGSPSRVPAAR